MEIAVRRCTGCVSAGLTVCMSEGGGVKHSRDTETEGNDVTLPRLPWLISFRQCFNVGPHYTSCRYNHLGSAMESPWERHLAHYISPLDTHFHFFFPSHALHAKVLIFQAAERNPCSSSAAVITLQCLVSSRWTFCLLRCIPLPQQLECGAISGHSTHTRQISLEQRAILKANVFHSITAHLRAIWDNYRWCRHLLKPFHPQS